MNRISRDNAMLSTAFIMSKRSTCQRAQIGAVISVDNRIISIGYNGAPSGTSHCTPETCNVENPCTRTVHAELNAILFAAKMGISTSDSTIYTTTQPCLNCSRAIINAGIKKVVYAMAYRDPSGTDLLRDSGVEVFHHGKFFSEVD